MSKPRGPYRATLVWVRQLAWSFERPFVEDKSGKLVARTERKEMAKRISRALNLLEAQEREGKTKAKRNG